ncbi:MAG: hypothetical protein AAGN35_19900 [Bacteroidota bacterium]
MSEDIAKTPAPEPERKPPLGSWSRMYLFVLGFLGFLILLFLLFSNTYTR